MATNIKAVNNNVKSYVEDVKRAIPIDRAVLFGSHAKGTATEHSDIDLCFFSDDFENKNEMDVLKTLFRMTRKYRGLDIEPHVFPTSEIKKDNPFVKEILRTGREI